MKQRELLFIVISLFTLVIIYIGFTVYNNAVTSTIPSALSIQIAPIDSSFNTKTIAKLKQRERINPSLETNPVPTPTPTVNPTPPISQPTPTTQPTPTNAASQSGQLGGI